MAGLSYSGTQRQPYTDPMLRLPSWFHMIRAALALTGLVYVFALPPAARAWGNEGHRLINRLAASTLPADVPAFLRSEAAVNEIEYLGPEPDRWRSPAEPELSAAQAPEHFIDLELADALGPLPRRGWTSRRRSLPPVSGRRRSACSPGRLPRCGSG